MFPSFPSSAWERTSAKLRFAAPRPSEIHHTSTADKRDPAKRSGTPRTRSEAQLGNAWTFSSSPTRIHFDQARFAQIVSGTRIPPMRRLIDISAFDRVIVAILQLLPHHVAILNLLGVGALLPDL